MMKRMIPRFVLGAGLCGLVASFAAYAQQQADAGKQLFMRNGCYECHGTEGAGGGIAGPQLAPDPLPIDAVKEQLRHPVGRMPPYSDKVISDTEIADIFAYLQSIPAGKPVSQIPLLMERSASTRPDDVGKPFKENSQTKNRPVGH